MTRFAKTISDACREWLPLIITITLGSGPTLGSHKRDLTVEASRCWHVCFFNRASMAVLNGIKTFCRDGD